MTVDPLAAFEAMDEVQARRAKDTPDRIRQVLSVAELAKAGALYVLHESPSGGPVWWRLVDAYEKWAALNPEAAAQLMEESE